MAGFFAGFLFLAAAVVLLDQVEVSLDGSARKVSRIEIHEQSAVTAGLAKVFVPDGLRIYGELLKAMGRDEDRKVGR